MAPALLVCPACREHAPAAPLEPAAGGLRCPRCASRYPVTVAPVVAHPLAPFVRAIADSHPAEDERLARALVPYLLDDDPLARRLQRTSVAARAHWGDRMRPAQPSAWDAFRPFLERLPAGDVVELGCGAGRVALELAAAGRRVVALDTDPAVLSLGVQVQAEGRARLLLRRIGAAYEPVEIAAPELRGRPVQFVLADAMSPPLAAEAFDAVVALNLLDNVRVPSTLLGQIDALLKPGGTLLLATPYAWDSSQVDDGERIGGAPGRPFGGEPEEELARVLAGESLGAPWRFELTHEERRLPWTLVRDERCRFQYELHVVLARKRG